MDKQCISVPGGPPQAGPYSHAVTAGGFVFVSGQIPIAPDGTVHEGGITEQTRLALSNLKTVLEAAGSRLDLVASVNVYLQSMGDFAAFNKVYEEFFTRDFPARTCVEVSRLPKDVQVEVAATAIQG